MYECVYVGPLKEVIDNNMNLNMVRTIKLFKDLTEDEKNKVSCIYSVLCMEHYNSIILYIGGSQFFNTSVRSWQYYNK